MACVFFDQIIGDTIRQCGSFSPFNFLFMFFRRRIFRLIIIMRLCHILNTTVLGKFFLPYFVAWFKFITLISSVDISWKTNIGTGFVLTHAWGVVINQNSIIGSNVTIFHGVTIGQKDTILASGERITKYPTIEDDVWIGPNAIIVGGVTVGRGSRIAGGAFITTDIPPYSIVSGNPSKIVKTNCIPDVVNPAFLDL